MTKRSLAYWLTESRTDTILSITSNTLNRARRWSTKDVLVVTFLHILVAAGVILFAIWFYRRLGEFDALVRSELGEQRLALRFLVIGWCGEEIQGSLAQGLPGRFIGDSFKDMLRRRARTWKHFRITAFQS